MARRFKNSAQRKAVMARLRNKNYNQIRSQGIMITKRGDADRDGVINIKDCKPFDPKKQGLLHDLQVKRLRATEERLERKREKEQKKLEDLKDSLKEKQGIANKKMKVRTLQLQQKQAIIDEINREKKKAKKLEDANRAAKAQLDKLTVTGRTKTAALKIGKATGQRVAKGSKIVLQSTQAFLQKKSTKRTLKKVGKAIFG